jgi:hypothetical protein
MGLLTEEEVKAVRKVIKKVWNEIGYDYLSGMDEDKQVIDRWEVADVCLDAYRWKDYGNLSVLEPAMDKLQGVWKEQTWKDEIEIILPELYWGI